MDYDHCTQLLAVSDTIHDFAKDNEDLTNYVVSTLTQDLEEIQRYMEKEDREELFFRDHKGLLCVKTAFEKDMTRLLTTKYFPLLGKNFMPDVKCSWETRKQCLRNLQKGKLQHMTLFLGSKHHKTGLFEPSTSPRDLTLFLCNAFECERIEYVVDRGTQLLENTFFCRNSEDKPSEYFGIASLYDRAIKKKDSCIRKEFQEYGVNHNHKQLLVFDKIGIQRTNEVQFAMRWSYMGALGNINLEYINDLVEIDEKKYNYLSLFKKVVDYIHTFRIKNVWGKPEYLANFGDLALRNIAIKAIRQRYSFDLKSGTEYDLLIFLRGLYDFKRIGDFLQVEACVEANKNSKDGTKFVFATNDRIASLYAAHRGVPCIRTISEKDKESQKKSDKYIEIFNIAPLTSTPSPDPKVKEFIQCIQSKPNKKVIARCMKLWKESPSTFRTVYAGLENASATNEGFMELTPLVTRRRFQTIKEVKTKKGSPDSTWGGVGENKLDVAVPLNLPKIIPSFDAKDPFRAFLQDLHILGIECSFLDYVMYRLLLDAMSDDEIARIYNKKREGSQIHRSTRVQTFKMESKRPTTMSRIPSAHVPSLVKLSKRTLAPPLRIVPPTTLKLVGGKKKMVE